MREPYVPKKRVNFLSNANILIEIAKSKNSYSSYLSPEHAQYSLLVEDEGDLDATLANLDVEIGTIVRVMTFHHIPRAEPRARVGREKNTTHERVNFPPYLHAERTDEGWRIVGKSHWKGGLENGWFSAQHGNLTSKYAMMLMKLVDRYGTRGNWRGYSYNDEMRGEALTNLCKVALQFNEARSENPFAYLTTCITNSFTRVLNIEKKIQRHRDDMMIEAGLTPSITRQVEHQMGDLPPLKPKRGRPRAEPKVKEPKTVGRPKGTVKPLSLTLPFEPIMPTVDALPYERSRERRDQIRYCLDNGGTVAAIARLFEVSDGLVSKIKHGHR